MDDLKRQAIDFAERMGTRDFSEDVPTEADREAALLREAEKELLSEQQLFFRLRIPVDSWVSANGTIVWFEVITPERAAYLLELNENVREVKPISLSLLVGDMGSGAWGLTGDTIKFNRFGELFDGQHRLTACVQSGKPIETFLICGDFDESKVDRGDTRTPPDLLKHEKFKYAKDCSAISQLILRSEKEARGEKQVKPSTEEVMVWCRANRTLIQELSRVATRFKGGLGSLIGSKYIGKVYWVLYQIEKDQARDYMEQLSDIRRPIKKNEKPESTVSGVVFTLWRAHDAAAAMGYNNISEKSFSDLIYRGWNSLRYNKDTTKFFLPKEKSPDEVPE